MSRTTALELPPFLSKDNQGPLVYLKVDDPCCYGAHATGRGLSTTLFALAKTAQCADLRSKVGTAEKEIDEGGGVALVASFQSRLSEE